MTRVFELNLDGLVGPTHHYAGLAKGNLASTTHAYQVANPQAAALQGIEKMRFLHKRQIKQAFLPPHERPNLELLRQLGFEGSLTTQLKKAAAYPHLLTACFSASSMWAANTATITPSLDSQDKRVHVTPANLVSQLHRHQEADFSSHLLKIIFNDPKHFVHHSPLPKTNALSDEGAANHNRICRYHHTRGIHLFVYGRKAFDSTTSTRFPARQTQEASEAIARRHQLLPEQVLYAAQNPEAIDLGVFHHDVIGVANENVILIHEKALLNQTEILNILKSKLEDKLNIIEVLEKDVAISDAVESYLFNSQLITLSENRMLLLSPQECETHPRVRPWIDTLLKKADHPIQEVQFFDLKQSMQNGGGPACLRLRVPLTKEELNTIHPDILITDEKLDLLEAWVLKHYRTSLHPNDLQDPKLIEEVHCALDELTQCLKLGSIYPFQKKSSYKD